MSTPSPLVAALLAPALVACGGGAGVAARPTSPFTEDDAAFFDGSVDFVEDPTGLEGRWADDWNRDLEERVGRLDLLAVVTVHTLRTDVDLERRSTYRLFARVDRKLFGEADVDELVLVVREGEPGFDTVDDNQRRILRQPFLAFVKFAAAEGSDAVVAKWHLSPVSQPVLDRVQALVQQRDPATTPTTRQRVVYN